MVFDCTNNRCSDNGRNKISWSHPARSCLVRNFFAPLSDSRFLKRFILFQLGWNTFWVSSLSLGRQLIKFEFTERWAAGTSTERSSSMFTHHWGKCLLLCLGRWQDMMECIRLRSRRTSTTERSMKEWGLWVWVWKYILTNVVIDFILVLHSTGSSNRSDGFRDCLRSDWFSSSCPGLGCLHHLR